MEKKTCTKCLQDKALTEYYIDKHQSDGHRPDCKECHKARQKHKYDTDENFRSQRLKAADDYIKGRRRDFQIRILTILKNTGCKDCGEKDPIVLDFDHMRDKTSSVSQMLRNHASWERLEEEIAKCEVRCSNCHRRKTARERGYYYGIDLASL